MSSVGGRIRKLDMFKKVHRDLSEGTNIGGFVSLVTVFLMSFLVFKEVRHFLNPAMKATIVEDELVTTKEMTINMDITFPRFPCEVISLDLQDIMMSHHSNIGSIKKYRLDSNGQRIDNEDFEILRQPNINTQFTMTREAFQKNRGCRLIGSFTVKEVPGNFHISSHAYQTLFMRLMMEGTIKTLDISHVINELYWGEISNINSIQQKHPQASLTPLRGRKFMFDMSRNTHSYTSHYHIDVVPTIYNDNSMFDTRAYQYTFNHNKFEVYHMPVVYFNYHIGGLMVKITPDNSGLGEFLIQLCAIIGGLYALASFIDNLLNTMFSSQGYELLQ